jgi:predicted N-formylglutamate amidohydrolase
MQRHIAFDIGAAGLTQRLADLLDAPAICANFSRLVIDPNRGEDDPTLVRRLYDETIIPANRHIGASDIEHRLERCYRPYHAKIAEVAARREDTVVIAVHSFTPRLRNRAMRPWHVGLLFAEDDRLSRPLMALLGAEGDLVVGENEPYPGYLKGDTIDRHASLQGRQNTLIEIRNDLIADEAGQTDWAARLARLLPKALEIAEEKGNENYGRQDKDRA